MEAMQQSFHQMMSEFNRRLDSIQGQLPSTSPASPGGLAAEFVSFKAFVVSTFRAVQCQMNLLSQQVDQGEMRARRKILLLHGLPEEQKEDTLAVVAKAMTVRLEQPGFTGADISRCHRMGRATTERPRPILIKLRDVALRDKIWASKSCLKGSGVTLSEFLTKTRHDVFLAARQRFGVVKCWTREGNIFVLGPDGTRHRVNSITDLDAVQPNEPVCEPKAAAKGTTANAGAGSSRLKVKKTVAAKK